jgi:hypothetical protein
MRDTNEVYIGYWKTEYKVDFYKEKYGDTVQTDPSGKEMYFPVENSATEDQTNIITRLKQAMKTGRMLGYRGWSICRICGKHNGTGELEITYGNFRDGKKQYRIPEGYVHYLEDHNVAVDPILEKILPK